MGRLGPRVKWRFSGNIQILKFKMCVKAHFEHAIDGI